MKKYNVSIITPFPVLGAGLKSILEKEEFSLDMVVNDYTQTIQLVKESNSLLLFLTHAPFYLVLPF